MDSEYEIPEKVDEVTSLPKPNSENYRHRFDSEESTTAEFSSPQSKKSIWKEKLRFKLKI